MKDKQIIITEKNKIIPLSRQFPIFYAEYSRIVKSNNCIKILSEDFFNNEGSCALPVAAIGSLLLGPGCSITTEAAKVLSQRGCMLSFTGGEGVPFFLYSSRFRSPYNKLKQVELILDERSRLDAIHILMKKRSQIVSKHFKEITFRDFPVGPFKSSESALASEGAWMKEVYSKLSKKYEVKWDGKLNDSKNRISFLSLLNSFCYDLAMIAIYHLGFDPNLGIMHGRTKGGGLVFDLADVYKPVLSLSLSFSSVKDQLSPKQAKTQFIQKAYNLDVVGGMVNLLKETIKV